MRSKATGQLTLILIYDLFNLFLSQPQLTPPTLHELFQKQNAWWGPCHPGVLPVPLTVDPQLRPPSDSEGSRGALHFLYLSPVPLWLLQSQVFGVRMDAACMDDNGFFFSLSVFIYFSFSFFFSFLSFPFLFFFSLCLKIIWGFLEGCTCGVESLCFRSPALWPEKLPPGWLLLCFLPCDGLLPPLPKLSCVKILTSVSQHRKVGPLEGCYD